MMELFFKNSYRLSAIFAKGFIIDVRLGSKYASEKTETFKMKLRLAKSLRLLQCAAFLVYISDRFISNIALRSKSVKQLLRLDHLARNSHRIGGVL